MFLICFNNNVSVTANTIVYIILFIPVFALSQNVERIEALEKRVAQLEKQLDDLEKVVVHYSNNKKVSGGNPKSISNWRKLEKGMSQSNVRRLLGEPKKVNGGYLTYWYYSSSSLSQYVIFDNNEKVHGWAE